jgi:hypothetical protein
MASPQGAANTLQALTNQRKDRQVAKADVTAEQVRELFDYSAETGQLLWRNPKPNRYVKAGDVAGTPDRYGYVVINLKGKLHRAHRLVWFREFGVWPSGDIDHIDGNRSNNRLSNLRDVTRTVNLQNRRSALAKSGLLGAYFHASSGLWCSRIRVNGREHSLGYHKTPEEAHAAYLAAKRKLHEGCTI